MTGARELIDDPHTRGDCPKCGGIARVTDSRPGSDADILRKRRRRCDNCGYGFSTIEQVVGDIDSGVLSNAVKAKEFERRCSALLREIFGDDGGHLRAGAGLGVPKPQSFASTRDRRQPSADGDST